MKRYEKEYTIKEAKNDVTGSLKRTAIDVYRVNNWYNIKSISNNEFVRYKYFGIASMPEINQKDYKKIVRTTKKIIKATGGYQYALWKVYDRRFIDTSETAYKYENTKNNCRSI